MNLLDNLSIKKRLALTLVFCIIAFISFGLFAITRIYKLSEITEDIYNRPLKVSNAAREARVDIIKIHRDSKDLILSNSELEINNYSRGIDRLDSYVISRVNIIKNQTSSNEVIELAGDIEMMLRQWREKRQLVIQAALLGDTAQATKISKQNNIDYINKLEDNLEQIYKLEEIEAKTFMSNASDVESSQRLVLLIFLLIFAFITIAFFYLITRSIVKPINILKTGMSRNIDTGDLIESKLSGKNELVDMSQYYNSLIKKLKYEFWMKNGQNTLNQHLTGNYSVAEVTQRTIQFIARFLDAGNGVFYIYNEAAKTLDLNASFAFTERTLLSNHYKLGEGLIGQVALEKQPILLKNIHGSDAVINTGTISQSPLNVYAFPLLYEGNLYGVIELSSFETFTEVKQKFIDEACKIIVITLYSALQNEKIKALLEESEQAKFKLQQTAEQLIATNSVLEEQQHLLQLQTEELQKTNAELEEQQQLLQLQSEELQQTNTQLEEQQQQLEEQSSLLNIQNHELEASREELINRTTALEMSSRYKSEFLANMSHELRTPLNSIILLSKLLMNNKKEFLSDIVRTKLNIIYNSGNELLRLINDILDLSKVESGKMLLNPTQFHSGDFLNDIKLLFQESTKEKKLLFTVEDLVESELYGDKNKISQIVRNLISNSIKFTESGFISVTMSMDRNYINLSVSDSGIGIAEDKLMLIFEEFQQGDGSISRKYGGTGLGLSISKKMAEFMGGFIRVRSEVGRGSTFSLYIPNLIQSITMDSTEALKQVAVTSDPSITGSQCRKVILVIEDDENFAEHIKELNEGMGFDTIIAPSGKNAIKMLQKFNVDGILLDLALPDISGTEILKQLKNSEQLKGIPVHIISSYNKNNELLKMGAIGFDEKPISDDDLTKLIQQMIAFSERRPKKLLIIEDDLTQRNTLLELLENKDIEIHCCATEEEAKSEITTATYDCIILDMDFNNNSGLSICKYASESKVNTPIIVYTSEELSTKQESELKLYAESIVLKTAHSDTRLLDEVALFLHRVKINSKKENYMISRTKESHSLDLSEKKILIVDDDSRNIFVLASALEEFNAEVYDAENGKDALEKLKTLKVDLILMDIMMPVLDGYETIAEIRKDDNLKHIPIIALTAKSLKDDRHKCIEAGANDYISKPVDYDIFTKLVKAWISKGHYS